MADGRLNFKKHLRSKKGVAASLEEIIMDANIRSLQQAFPDVEDLKLKQLLRRVYPMFSFDSCLRELSSENLAGVTFSGARERFRSVAEF